VRAPRLTDSGVRLIRFPVGPIVVTRPSVLGDVASVTNGRHLGERNHGNAARRDVRLQTGRGFAVELEVQSMKSGCSAMALATPSSLAFASVIRNLRRQIRRISFPGVANDELSAHATAYRHLRVSHGLPSSSNRSPFTLSPSRGCCLFRLVQWQPCRV